MNCFIQECFSLVRKSQWSLLHPCPLASVPPPRLAAPPKRRLWTLFSNGKIPSWKARNPNYSHKMISYTLRGLEFSRYLKYWTLLRGLDIFRYLSLLTVKFLFRYCCDFVVYLIIIGWIFEGIYLSFYFYWWKYLNSILLDMIYC